MLDHSWGRPSVNEIKLNFAYSQLYSMIDVERGDWSLNQNVFDRLNVLLGPFDVDVCASSQNNKLANYFTSSNSCFDNVEKMKGSRLYSNAPFSQLMQVFQLIDRVHKFALFISKNEINSTILCLCMHTRTHTIMSHLKAK